MTVTPSLKQSMAILLMASQLSSCTSWRLETVSPRELVDNRHPAVVRVERADAAVKSSTGPKSKETPSSELVTGKARVQIVLCH
ncbi:MAG: hypothetical protein AUH41_03180 [Gemmatimonadetes bacterium 13_1_40CM_66_11]|nr:MAG: hypothetical protein AUH41_03180 [Gemmatimonadetes bacterium 13_1_40CM_66_11]